MRNRIHITKCFEPWAWIIFILLSGIFILLNYAGTEGLNPSDDGVILAQSWRMLQGEIPHLDFISIRPVASGVLHSIHFLSPFSLEITARYFVLFQFFVIAFCMVQFFQLRTKNELPVIYRISILIIAWIFSIYNYNLFPWTTIDAIFWSSIGFFFSEKAFYSRRKFVYLSFGLFAFTMAALSRQTFALVAMIGWMWVAIRLYYRKEWTTGLISFFVGGIPLLIYAIVIAFNDAGLAFLSQMSGRTEFYQVAIKSVHNYFKNNDLRWLYVGIIIISLVAGISKLAFEKARTLFATPIAKRIVLVIESALVVYFFYCSAEYFMSCELNGRTMPYRAFWLLFVMLVIATTVQGKKIRNYLPAFTALFIAWVSLISLGDNSPVFSFGVLSAAILWIYLDKYHDVLLKQNWLKYAFPVITLFFIVISTHSQMQVNYRDLGKSEHTKSLKDINPIFGNITTNENTWNYFYEADSIIKDLSEQKKHFCFMPDNAILYPLYRIKNPMSIDWAQKGEITNQTERFNRELFWMIDEDVVFVVQKVNAKLMADGFENIEEWKYPYFQILKDNCRVIGETNYFILYQH